MLLNPSKFSCYFLYVIFSTKLDVASKKYAFHDPSLIQMMLGERFHHPNLIVVYADNISNKLM